MALGDIKLARTGGLSSAPTLRFRVQAGATTINAGEPCKLGTAGAAYAIPSATAEPVTGTPTFLGIAASTSTQTASADGFVDVYVPINGVVFKGTATAPASIDTDAELVALLNNGTVFTLASGRYTVNESAAHAATNGLHVVDADITTGEVYFTVKAACVPYL